MILTLSIQRRAEQQKVLYILNAIACLALGVYGIPKIRLDFKEFQFAETNSQLSKIG